MTEETNLVPTNERAVATGYLEPPIIGASALEALNRSELDVQIMTARRFPRSIANFRAKALTMIRLDTETARSCYYALPRRQRQDDGSVKKVIITGPSVRLAEIVAVAWGNLRTGTRKISESDKAVTAQGFAHDLESNFAKVQEVDRRIVDRDGRRYSDDMVTMTTNAAGAIAWRNAVLSVVPKALVNPLVEVAKKTAAGDQKTLAASRTAAVKAFQELGVTPAALCDKLERQGVEDIDLEDLVLLGGLLTAIKENMTSVEAEFPKAATPQTPGTTLQDAIARRRRDLTSPEAETSQSPPPAETKA